LLEPSFFASNTFQSGSPFPVIGILYCLRQTLFFLLSPRIEVLFRSSGNSTIPLFYIFLLLSGTWTVVPPRPDRAGFVTSVFSLHQVWSHSNSPSDFFFLRALPVQRSVPPLRYSDFIFVFFFIVKPSYWTRYSLCKNPQGTFLLGRGFFLFPRSSCSMSGPRARETRSGKVEGLFGLKPVGFRIFSF